MSLSTAAGAGWLSRYRSALARADVRRLFGGLVISATGSWAYNVALLAWVYERTHALGWVTAAALVRFIPALLFSAYGGVVAERFERVRLMACSDIACAACQAGLAAVAAAGGPVAAGLVLAALSSTAAVVYQPAVAATIPSLVSEDDLTAANALNGTIDELVVIAGPALGALLLVLGASAVVFAVNAASFLASAALVSRIRTRSAPVDVTDGGSAGPLRQMIVGARTIARLPAARTLVAYSALVSFVYGTDTVLFVGVSAHRLGTGADGLGYLLAGLGAGGLLAAGAVDRLSGSGRLGLIIVGGALGYTLPTALLTIIHAPVLGFLVQVLRGASTLVVDVLAVTALQRAVAPELLARVFGVFFAFVLAAITLGSVLIAPLSAAIGLTGALWAAALAPAVVAVAGYPALRAVDRQTAAGARALEPRVALLESIAVFTGAARSVLERLAAAASAEAYLAGTVVVREGDAADALYVLAEGTVEVTTAAGAGSGGERRVATITAPNVFGEIGVIDGVPRTATVTTVEPCRCERIDGRAFLDALQSAPPPSALMETVRSRRAVTHPPRALEPAVR